MKIGLLTYHISPNIGAMMQTYATCRALKQLGHEVIIIDIRQQDPEGTGVQKIITDILYYKQKKEHQAFRNQFYPEFTHRYYTIEELRADPPGVDCLVVGSDQTWNPAISQGAAMAYFLDFGDEKIKRFSYASSFGMEEWNQHVEITKDVNEALHKLKCISVREKTAVEICKDTFGLTAQLAVDPTLLFDDYPEITGAVPQKNEILCYKLRRIPDFFDNIGIIKKKLSLPARLLNNAYPVRGLRYTYPPSVAEWIKRIGGAKFVLTDSFHGVAFSLIYKRQFTVIRNHNGRDQRFEDLLKAVGLESRIFNSVEEMAQTDIWKKQIDYTAVKPKLEEMKQASWYYLKQALS